MSERSLSVKPTYSPAVPARHRLVATTALLAVVWALSFTTDRLPFLPTVPVAATLVLAAGLWVRRSPDLEVPRHRWNPAPVAAGLLIAALHYGVGRALFRLVSPVVPVLATSGAEIIARTEHLPGWALLLVAAVYTAPAEELFWRGAVHPFVTRRTDHTWVRVAISATAYTAFHVVTLQPALIAAAALAGIVWGWTVERHGLLGATVAHAAWTGAMLLAPPI